MSRKQMGFFEINKKKYAIFEGLNVIGRDMRATVLLKDVKFSKQHAIISILDDNIQFISDFGSCNGTKLRDALLEPYKFYNLTGEDRISFSDVTGIYHKFTIPQPKIPESQSIPESQTCDHFALTQKLPNETIQNIHDCPTQTYNVNESIIDQINSAEIQGLLSHEVKTRGLTIQDSETQNSQLVQSPKCDFKTPVLKSNNTITTQKLPIHEASTQELPIHDTKTQGLAIHNAEIQNPNHKTSIINKNQGLPIHEALTQGLAIDDSETQNLSCTPNLPTSQDNDLKTQSTNENLLLATNNIHDTISQNISNVTQNIELYDDVFANETFRLSLTNNNNTMYGVEVDETVLTPDKSKTIDSDQDSIDMLTEAATQDFAVHKSPKLVCVPQSFEGKIKSPVTSVISPNRNLKTTLTSVKGNSDSGTDIEDGVLANLSLTGKIAALEKKIRKKKFASRQNQTSKSSPVQKKSFNSDSETDMEDNIGLKVNEECSKQIVAQPENRKIIESDSETDAEDYLIQKSKPVDDDSTDIEDNLELIKTIDEASKSMDASRDLVKIPVDDDLTEVEDNLELIKKIDEATKHNDNNGNAKRKSIKNDIKTKTRVSSNNKTNNKNNAPVNISTNNQIKSNNNIDEDDDATDDDLDLLAPTQKLSYFNSQASTQQSTQNKNHTSDKVDIYSAETQKLDVSDFADDMIPTSQFLTDLKLNKIDKHVVATQDFDFLAPTQLLMERPIQDSAPMLETQDVDFLAPTQLLESTSKPLANSKSQIEDDYLAPTQILLPILSGPFPKTLEPKPSTSKNTDFYFGSKSPRPALQNESIYDAPTQKFTIHTSIFDAPTQRLSAGDGKLCSAVEDVFMAPTQMLSIPDGDGTDKNNTAASASDAMRLYLSDINEDDIQPTQKLDLSAFETKESKAKKLEQDKSESLKRSSKDHSELPNNENNIDTTTEKSIYTLAKESETQLEVDFALPTQKLYVEEQTSRPNNPVANMFDEENTQTQDEIFDTVPVQNISKSTIIVEKLTLRDPEPSASNSNNQNDSKTKPLTHSDPESVSNKENQSEPKSPEIKPGPVKRSLRKKTESPKASNKKLTPKLTKESKEFNESNSSKLIPKPNPTKRTIQSDLESSLDSNQESSNALKRNLDEGEPVSNKRLRKPSWKVLDKTKSPKGRKTGDLQTPKTRRNTRQTISRASEDTSLSDDDNRYGMGDSARKNKLLSATSHAVDGFYSNPTTSKAGRGDGSSAQKQIQSLSETLKSKLMTKSVQNSPRTRMKRKSKLVVRSEPVEPIAIIDDSDSDGSSIESYIKRKVFKMDDTETDYTSSSCSTIRPKKSGRHKIEDYSSDETEPSTSILADTKRYGTLNVTSQPQNVKHKVAFTMLNDDKLEEKVEILGGDVTMNIYSSTVLVTNKISRSLKFLVAVSLAKPIVGDKWIKESMKKKRFLDPWDYLLEDREAETSYNFVLKDSIYRALKKKLLLNYTILLAVKKNFDVLKEIIESCGGKVVTRAPSKSLTGIFIVVGYPDEPAKYSRYLKQKATVVSAEAIFAGVLHQKMSINKHLLS